MILALLILALTAVCVAVSLPALIAGVLVRRAVAFWLDNRD
jgi:hypothetical protein